ncbi:transposase [Arthrobacter psychrolactophilus]
MEIGDWTRFTVATNGSSLGLVPSEQSSGKSWHRGSVTQVGRKFARKLVEVSAWQHRRPTPSPGCAR